MAKNPKQAGDKQLRSDFFDKMAKELGITKEKAEALFGDIRARKMEEAFSLIVTREAVTGPAPATPPFIRQKRDGMSFNGWFEDCVLPTLLKDSLVKLPATLTFNLGRDAHKIVYKSARFNERFNHTFTLRIHSKTEEKREHDRALSGLLRYMVYGIADPDEEGLHAAYLLDMELLKQSHATHPIQPKICTNDSGDFWSIPFDYATIAKLK